MKQTFNIEIMGQRLSIKSNESQAQVDRVVQYINEQMKNISKDQRAMAIHDVTLLTLLNISDELFKMKAEIGEYKEKIIEKTKNIIRIIDA